MKDCLAALVFTLLLARGMAADLVVFAAASLSDALREVATAYESSGGDRIRFNFASSSALARQIKEGAPADVFFSADEAKMDELQKAGVIVPETRRSLVSNTLVIVVLGERGAVVNHPSDLAQPVIRRIALAETATVPAGIYAREYLEKVGLWVQIAPKVVGTENVRAALAAVESGNVEAGMVYKTDALISAKVKIACEISTADGPNITYPVAVVGTSKQADAARHWVAYLASAEALAVFLKFGFLPAP